MALSPGILSHIPHTAEVRATNNIPPSALPNQVYQYAIAETFSGKRQPLGIHAWVALAGISTEMLVWLKFGFVETPGGPTPPPYNWEDFKVVTFWWYVGMIAWTCLCVYVSRSCEEWFPALCRKTDPPIVARRFRRMSVQAGKTL